MSEPDVLERAAKALRDAHTGEREGSGFTRARIMTSLHRKRRGQLLRWAVLSPLASLVLVGSAWAHSSGKWPAVWRAVTSVFSAAPASPAPERPESAAEREPPPLRSPGFPAPPARAEAPRESDRLELEARGARQAEPARPVRRRARPQPAPEALVEPSARQRRAPSEASESAPAADPELSKFRRAHELHFRARRPREAIAAYASYLEEFPNGRFVPEARYNTALNWIKLGDKAAARAALAPFARGAYAGYRREEARQLLQALR